MKSKSSLYKKLFQLVIIFLLMVFLCWIINEETKTRVHGEEFYLQWASGRLLAIENENPYTTRIPVPDFIESPTTTRGFPRQFNTPLYSLLLTFPFVLIDNFNTAFLAWVFFSEILVLGLLICLIKLTDWKIHPVIVGVVFTYMSFSYSSFRAFSAGSLIILTGVLLMLSFLSLKSNKNELAAVLLAFTTIQPHFFVLVYILAIIWGISVRRWSYVIWFLAGIFILSILGAFVIPGWMLDYARVLWKFKANFMLWAPGDILLLRLPGVGMLLGRGLTFVLSALLLVEWIIARGKDVQWFFWTTCLTLTVTQLAGIPIDLAEQFILVIPLMLILSVWVQRTKILGQRIMLGSMIGLFAVPWYLAYKAGFENHLETPGISLFFIVPIIILIGVLWIRWWAVRPMRLYIEELRGNEGG